MGWLMQRQQPAESKQWSRASCSQRNERYEFRKNKYVNQESKKIKMVKKKEKKMIEWERGAERPD
jgi:hypothetical protein